MTTNQRWLSIIGIGEDGIAGLAPAAKMLIEKAALVVGGARHLALAGTFSGERMVWPSPPEAAFPEILAKRGQPVCVLASGDPFFYGIGSVLMRDISRDEMVCIPSVSAFSLAAARLGWALQDCALVSLHGRALAQIVRHLQPGARILALSWDGDTPNRLAAMLVNLGHGAAVITVLEAMGGRHERLRSAVAANIAMPDIHPLNTIAIEIPEVTDAQILPLGTGLPDACFIHDGQITKREVRAMTLSALMPCKGALLWDVGAGSGSIAIEWLLLHPANRALAFEQNAARCTNIQANALALGAPTLQLVEGMAPMVLAGQPAPDAIFIGGGAGVPGVIDAALAALRRGGRLVINAVTLETQALLTQCLKAHGGGLTAINIAHADPVGRFHGWRHAMPVVQWRMVKP